jgi:hypothetical protein
MTATLPATPSPRPFSRHEARHEARHEPRREGSREPHWPEQLSHVLRPTCFPARQDELLATLIRHRAPSHLMWRLTCLPRTRQFSSLAEVVAYVDGHATTGTVAEPV